MLSATSRRYRRVIFVVVLIASLLGVESAFSLLGGSEIRLPMNPTRSGCVVPLYIGSAGPFPFLVDAGIRFPVLSDTTQAAQALPLLPADDPSPQAVTVSRVHVELSPAPQAPLYVGAALVADINGLSERCGTPLSGVLPIHQPGLEVTLDYPNRVAVWRPLGKDLLSASRASALTLRIESDGQPRLRAKINDAELRWLAVDLSFGGTLALHEDTLRKVCTLESTPTMETVFLQKSPIKEVRLSSLQIGDLTVRTPLCTLIPNEQPEALGVALWKHTALTLNFEQGIARVDSPEPILTEPTLSGCGLVLDTFQDASWRVGVVRGSPAERAGAQPGDILVSVNSIPTASLPVDTLSSLLCGEAGSILSVTISRAGRELTATLIAETLL